MAKKKSVSATKAKPAAKASKVGSPTSVVKPAKKKVPRKAAASKTKTAKKPAAKTVDGILKAFDKERVSKNSALSSTRKKIETLTKQVAKVKMELENLKKTAVETEIAIETLDSRRDAEVGALLSGMGVDLSRAAASAKPKAPVEKSTPLFDAPAKDDSKIDGDKTDAS